MKNHPVIRSCLRLATLLILLSAPLSTTWAAEKSATYPIQSININTADAQQIAAALNGIGLKKARTIVAWREQNGQFTDINQLRQIKGVGKKTLSKNSDRITLE